MVVYQGVTIDDEGQCKSVNISQTESGLMLQNNVLFVHYSNEDENIMILSTTRVESVAKSKLLSFSLPPPLNYYIYPHTVVILSGSEKKPKNLTCDLLIKHCTQFKATMNTMESNLNVYDVPLAETTYEDNEDDSDEEEELYAESYNEDDNEEGEEDWEEEEDDVPVG
tara:strand:- start:1681 stop:2184 length:504 start_codon:yes stop_codon:yes gene_type:complete